jgi:tRNA(Ile)-lysidine synthase
MNLNYLFEKHLTDISGVRLTSKFLLAVSGGVDSMVMLHLFHSLKLKIAVAHCNFSLRGEESNLDHELIKTYCENLNIPFYELIVDTAKIVEDRKIGVQEVARNIRYEWFKELCKKHQLDFIVTAHHSDDNVETVLMNIVRGTGIKGLKGIPNKNDNIIRPILFASKKDLVDYASFHQVPYRNDSSNNKNTYTRNKLRNDIIPRLQELNSEAKANIHKLSNYSYAVSSIISEHIADIAHAIVRYENDTIRINCKSIIKSPRLFFYMYELLSSYGFTTNQIQNIKSCLQEAKSGTQFFASSHIATVNRQEIIVQTRIKPDVSQFVLPFQEQTFFSLGFHSYSASIVAYKYNQTFELGKLYLDTHLLSFPLIIRKWKRGDSFSPLGMKGKKKVSDFLIDRKVSVPDKEDTFIVESNKKIVAILNHQIDEAFKVTPNTQQVLILNSI